MSWDTMARLVRKTGIKTFKTAGVYTQLAAPLSPITIDGVFDMPNHDVSPVDGPAVQSEQITFGIDLIDLGIVPAAGDSIVIKTKTYRILESREDGQGGSDLILGEL